MHILCLELNHTTAPIGLREKLALDENVVRIALSRLACGHIDSPLTELVILSTCNRVELYAASSETAFAGLEVFLADVTGVPVEQFALTHTVFRIWKLSVICSRSRLG